MLFILSRFGQKCQHGLHFYIPVVVLAAWSGWASSPSYGATVLKLHPSHDKVLLSLTTAEVQFAADRQTALVEVGAPPFVASGTLTKLNATKKTVVLELTEPDERFAVKQQVTFLPLLANVASSPIITSAAQYPNGTHTMVEAGGGGFFEGLRESVGSNKGQTTTSGGRFTAHGYMVLDSRAFGLNLDYEHRASASVLKPVGSSATMALSFDQLVPGGWLELTSGLRFGLSYDYAIIVQSYGGDQHGSYQFSVGRPLGTLLWTDANAEAGLDVSAEHNAGASAEYKLASSATQTRETRLYKAPAEVFLHYRRATSAFFAWGTGLGYLFFNRSQGPGRPLEPRASVPQQLRLRLNFEQRYSDGDKIEWLVSYDGGKAYGLSSLELTANELSVQGTYQALVANKWICGATVAVAGGYSMLADSKVDASGQPVESRRKVVGYQSSVLAFVNYAFDPLLARGRR